MSFRSVKEKIPAKTSIIILMIADFMQKLLLAIGVVLIILQCIKIKNSQKLPNPNRIEEVAQTILNGGIAAIKGIGGIFLVCSATDSDAIARLRDRKRDRKNKPFAVMFPSLEKAQNIVKSPLKSKIY